MQIAVAHVETSVLRFDLRCGSRFSVVWNQRVGVGGPDLSQMEPIDELDAADREFQDRRVAPLLNVDQPLCHFRVVRAYLSVSTTYSIVDLAAGWLERTCLPSPKENSGDRQTTR